MINTKFEAILESVENAYNIGELTEEQAFEVLELAEERYGDSLLTEAEAGSKANIGKIVAGVGLATAAVALATKYFVGRKNKNDNLNDPEIKTVYNEMKNLESKLVKSRRLLDATITELNDSIKNYNDIAHDVGSPTINLVRSYNIPYRDYDEASGYVTKIYKVSKTDKTTNPAYNPKLAMKAKKAINEVAVALVDVRKASAELRTEYFAFIKTRDKFEKMIKTKAPLSETNKKYDKNMETMRQAKNAYKDHDDEKYARSSYNAFTKNKEVADKFSDESLTYNHNHNINFNKK